MIGLMENVSVGSCGVCMKRLGFGRQSPRRPTLNFSFRDVSRVIRGMHEKTWFWQAIFQESEISIASIKGQCGYEL